MAVLSLSSNNHIPIYIMTKNLLITALWMIFSIIPSYAQQCEYALVVHGGAGNLSATENDPVRAQLLYAAMDSALQAGERVLSEGGEAEKAVMAVVTYLENNPLFNAGKGATVTAEGSFELDAAIMLGKHETGFFHSTAHSFIVV